MMASAMVGSLLRKQRFHSSLFPVDLAETLAKFANVQLNARGKEFYQLQRLYKELNNTEQEAVQVQHILSQPNDHEMTEIFQHELQKYTNQLKEQEEGLLAFVKTQFIADGAKDDELVLEIRAGTGGIEAMLFANEMAELYKKYCILKRWKLQEIDSNRECSKSLREGIFLVNGPGCRAAFEHEGGVHRVQRVPASEGSGRVHTSTVTVAVLPKLDSQFQLNPSDIRLELYRAASGPGGQHLNTTASAVRITHIPTGIIAGSMRERCQHSNRAHAMKLLQVKLSKHFAEKQANDLNSTRKEQASSFILIVG